MLSAAVRRLSPLQWAGVGLGSCAVLLALLGLLAPASAFFFPLLSLWASVGLFVLALCVLRVAGAELGFFHKAVVFGIWAVAVVYFYWTLSSRSFVYVWDYANYLLKQYDAEAAFAQSTGAGFRFLLDSITEDYTNFITLFTEFPFCLSGKTGDDYAFCQVFSVLPSLLVLLAGLMVWGPIRLLEVKQKNDERTSGVDMPSYGGVVANSYLPSNWISALGLYAWAQVDESSDNKSLINPAKKFTYVAPKDIDDTYVVFIIGETTRWDHMGILGYNRDTTPKLAQEKNLIAYRGYSCDTATKLSLRCMFVREGGASDNPQRTLKEQNVFSVLHQLGFTSDLYAMQSEMWFYSNTMAQNISYREQIGAEARNRGKPVDDMLLIDEMKLSLNGNPDGKHMIILHTKGSHFNYTQRYPRSFAKWTPECVGVDKDCTKAQLINSYDNSVMYVDHFIDSVIDQVRDKKAIVFYAADHGESINEFEHLHGTPRKMAPPEQFRVPMMVWMSDKYLEDPEKAKMFAHLKKEAEMKVPRRHVELYDTIMGCLGYTSPNGGINENNNWCKLPDNSAKAAQ